MKIIRAALYVRVEAEGRGWLTQLQAQEQATQALSDQNGWEVVETLVDVGPGRGWQRPGLLRLQAQAHIGAFDVLVVTEPRRLFDDPRKAQQFVTTLKQMYGVDVIFTEPVLEGGVA